MRRWLLAAVLLVTACGRSSSTPATPAGPTPVPPAAAFSGYWTGTFTYQGCLGSHCLFVAERTDPFSLRLRQSGTHVRGLFESRGSNIEISGEIHPDGSLQLIGTEMTGGSRGAMAAASFNAPDLRLDSVTGLTGTMRFEQQFFITTDPRDRMVTVADGRIVSATHQDLDVYLSDLSGKWKGRYFVRGCADELSRPLCGLFRQDEVELLELSLTVGGGSAVGELVPVATRIPVTGSSRGRSLDLQGTLELAAGRTIERITGFAGTVDEFGRLKGQFSYQRLANGGSANAEVELLQVVKVQ